MAGEFDSYYKWLAIPPDEQPPNLYRLLGLRLFEEDAGVIEMAAERQMIHVRNFQSGPHFELTQRLLNEISSAKSVLFKVEKKAFLRLLA